MSTLVKKQPNPWYVAVVSGMASYIDSCAIITSGTALAIYQAAFAGTAHALSNIQFGALESSLTLCIAIASIIGMLVYPARALLDIVFSSRLCCAAFGLFTASIISFNVKFAFILLALFCVIGFASAILVFRKRRYNTFEEDDAAAAAEVVETKEA